MDYSNGMNGSINGNHKFSDYDGVSFVLKDAEKLYLHTGNVSNWNRFKRKTTQDASEELQESFGLTLSSCLPANNNTKHSKVIRCQNKQFSSKISPDERELLKVSVKIFALELNPSLLQEAFFRGMCELGIDSVDTLFISLPPIAEMGIMMGTWTRFWQEAEKLFEEGYVDSLAVCDLDKDSLEHFCGSVRMKPVINQVNLAQCCAMPKELVGFCKEKQIQLLTHGDPQEIFNEEQLHSTMISHCGVSIDDVKGWQPSWVLRYSVLAKCRGVIKDKGYIVSCKNTGL